MNNNSTTEKALLAGCNGVFEKASYISFGTKENPLKYGFKMDDRSNYAGKQMMTGPAKRGKTTDVYFQKQHAWVMDGETYTDRLLYRETQPEKKKGFLTGDFKRRDEFSSDFRTRQYREQLKGEEKYSKKMLQLMAEQQGPEVVEPVTEKKEEGPTLFDLVYNDTRFDVSNSGASKVARDTKNPTLLSHSRNFGTMRTTSMISHQAPESFSKPQYARKPVVKDTFYRKTNVFFPDGAAAVTQP